MKIGVNHLLDYFLLLVGEKKGEVVLKIDLVLKDNGLILAVCFNLIAG